MPINGSGQWDVSFPEKQFEGKYFLYWRKKFDYLMS